MPSSGASGWRLLAPGLGCSDCNGNAIASEPVPLQGVSCQSRSASSAACLHSGGLRCQMLCRSAIRTCGMAAGHRCGAEHQLVALGIVGLDLRPRQGFDS